MERLFVVVDKVKTKYVIKCKRMKTSKWKTNKCGQCGDEFSVDLQGNPRILRKNGKLWRESLIELCEREEGNVGFPQTSESG